MQFSYHQKINPLIMAEAITYANRERVKMRKAAKIDDNQAEIVAALRGVHATVQILSSVGKGCPDILVGFRGQNYLMEIKDGTKYESRRSLTPDQKQWHMTWRGQKCVVCSAKQALEVLGVIV